MMTDARRRRIGLAAISLGYLLITVAYGVVNPLFEAPDEHWHFFTVTAIVEGGGLPSVTDPPDEWLGQEAAQPPLYYLLGAAIIAPFDSDGAREAIRLNPFAWIGDASALANVNRMVHSPAEAWPWHGWVRAAHFLRLFSTLLGLGTLLCIYRAGRALWPEGNTRPLMATALAAFLPQFNFIHASISNDALIIFLCSLGLLQLILLWRDPPEEGRFGQKDALRFAALGVTVGLAILSKNAGTLLLFYSVGFIAVLAIRDRNFGLIGRSLLYVGLPAILVGGWLWARNQMLYGDWTATAPFIEIAGGDRGYSLWQVLRESWGMILSFVGVFGWFNLRPPSWVYWVWFAVVALAAAGGAVCAARALKRECEEARERPGDRPGFLSRVSHFLSRSDWSLALLLLLWPFAVYSGLAMFMMKTEAAQGRLLFPAILPIALGVAWGLSGWGRCAPDSFGAFNRRLAPLVVLATVATTLYCVFFVVRPAYALPRIVEAIPSDARPVLPELFDRGRGVSLLAAGVEAESVEPGDVVWLTLYWQTNGVAMITRDDPVEFVLELFGRDLKRIANLHSYHGRGLYPADLWPSGVIVADRFAVRIDPEAETPVLARIFARVAGGSPGIEVATIRVVPAEPQRPAGHALAEIGENIVITGVTIVPERVQSGQTVDVLVNWYVSVGRPQLDYTTLVHLGQPDEPPLTTGDSPPVSGSYPTSAWRNGEAILDTYRLVIPDDLEPGRYPVWIGLYDPATGERLPVKVDGTVQPNGVYLAGWIEVE